MFLCEKRTDANFGNMQTLLINGFVHCALLSMQNCTSIIHINQMQYSKASKLYGLLFLKLPNCLALRNKNVKIVLLPASFFVGLNTMIRNVSTRTHISNDPYFLHTYHFAISQPNYKLCDSIMMF